DPMVMLRVVTAVGTIKQEKLLEKFCAEYGLRSKAVQEIAELQWRLAKEAYGKIPELNLHFRLEMVPPSDIQCKLLRQIMLIGMPDHVAKKIPRSELKKHEVAKWRYAAYRCTEMEEPVFIHPISVFKESPPEWLVYQEIFETSEKFMKGITAIEPEWLPIYARGLCNLSAPLDAPLPRFDEKSEKMYCYVRGTFGKHTVLIVYFRDGYSVLTFKLHYFLITSVYHFLFLYFSILL
ncbi:hypothetical protein L9F63_027889, partial [Diploptera punctata]